MVVDDLTLLPIIGNGAEGPYVITHYWEWWWTTFRYYPLWGMVLEDLTLLPIIESYYLLLGMVVDDLALLPIVGNGGEGLTLLLIILKGGGRTLLFIMGNGVGQRYVITHY